MARGPTFPGTFLEKTPVICVRGGGDASEKFFVPWRANPCCLRRFAINPDINEESRIELKFQLKYL